MNHYNYLIYGEKKPFRLRMQSWKRTLLKRVNHYLWRRGTSAHQHFSMNGSISQTTVYQFGNGYTIGMQPRMKKAPSPSYFSSRISREETTR
ncbi:hypothetical protein SAMN04487866_12316 [Thermoactinomyces sp. DSM 45891]|uniref:hypothetical protein n=1 Tax=Thermoactinomyces sp. DSM 45891 TaxID=1761907 RepID=UPI0009232F21|nr:hypothetical protein [Thermoactinomyces sp. DSM 45891]SFX76163.1 hypothetical protein SAMN04487866_12316 [Thermoactinomyces sp. DSM 45891]